MEAVGTQAIKGMCAFSFHTIATMLSENKVIKYPASFPQISALLFVTWQIEDPKYKELILRGCIGTFAEAPLNTQLSKYSLISAFKDSRYSSIKKTELERLHCTVSILCNFEKIKDPYDWQIGKHGVEISFEYKGRPYSSTFLPEVAEEEHWTQQETLNELLLKADFHRTLAQAEKLEVTRYQSKKETLTYKEYIAFIKENATLFEAK